MRIDTRSGNAYLYDRTSNRIGFAHSMQASPLDDLYFVPVKKVDRLINLSTFIIEFTRDCNLRCKYCCYSGSYPQHRKHATGTTIDMERIEKIGDFIEDNRVKDRQLYISFYGGEPFVNKRLLKEAVEYYQTRFPGVDITISTNLTIPTIEDLSWCISHDVSLNVSIDGTREIHDRNRVSINGQGTFHLTYNSLRTLFSLSPQFFDTKVNLLVTMDSIDNLLPIAKYWIDDLYLKTKEPYLISGVSPNYPNVKDLDVVHIQEKLYELLDYYEHNRNSLFCKAYFNMLTSPILEREVYDLHGKYTGLVCLPDNKRCFIDIDGSLGICEKCSDSLRIGTLSDGFDMDKVNCLAADFTRIKNERCQTCEIARLCQTCFSSYHLNDADFHRECLSSRQWTHIAMQFAIEMVERNLFDSDAAKKCRLRPLDINDAPKILEIFRKSHVVKHIDGISPLKNIAEAKFFINLLTETTDVSTQYMYGIIHEDTGLIGVLGIDQFYEKEESNKETAEYPEANLFFALDEPYWQQSIMTAMLTLFLTRHANTAYQTDRNGYKIIANISPKNKFAQSLKSKFDSII